MKKGNTNECAKSLRYDMGNIGDLVKHGMMAEFIRWWRGVHPCQNEFTFLDPFGGCVWAHPANSKALARLHTLREIPDQNFAIFDSQPDIDEGTYYGSAHVVINQVRRFGLSPRAMVSDGCERKVKSLLESDNGNIYRLACPICPRFKPADGYTVLDCIADGHIKTDLVLIDPFYEISKIKRNIRKIVKAAEKTSVLLFVLVRSASDGACIRNSLPNHIVAISPPLGKDTGVRGETMMAYVILGMPASAKDRASDLCANIKKYAESLGDAVNDCILTSAKI